MFTAIVVLFIFDVLSVTSIPGYVYATLAILKMLSILLGLFAEDVTRRR